jgi:hypothetical protein
MLPPNPFGAPIMMLYWLKLHLHFPLLYLIWMPFVKDNLLRLSGFYGWLARGKSLCSGKHLQEKSVFRKDDEKNGAI